MEGIIRVEEILSKDESFFVEEILLKESSLVDGILIKKEIFTMGYVRGTHTNIKRILRVQGRVCMDM